MTEIKTVEHYIVEKKLRPRGDLIAARLRELADEVEQEMAWFEAVGSKASLTYSDVAARIQARVLNALPGLSLDALTSDAAEADVARAKGE